LVNYLLTVFLAININGKICYVEIPVLDIERSAEFDKQVFRWRIRRRNDGSVAFDDTVEVSGTWVLNRKPGVRDELDDSPNGRQQRRYNKSDHF
jgi:predicted enzyme related to lactoylglutathione lyase